MAKVDRNSFSDFDGKQSSKTPVVAKDLNQDRTVLANAVDDNQDQITILTGGDLKEKANLEDVILNDFIASYEATLDLFTGDKFVIQGGADPDKNFVVDFNTVRQKISGAVFFGPTDGSGVFATRTQLFTEAALRPGELVDGAFAFVTNAEGDGNNDSTWYYSSINEEFQNSNTPQSATVNFVLGITGDIADLDTTDKTNLVVAINETFGIASTNATNIATNTDDITQNELDIGQNADAISTNQTNISNLQTATTDLDTRMTQAEADIIALDGRVGDNDTDIAQNASDITQLQADILDKLDEVIIQDSGVQRGTGINTINFDANLGVTDNGGGKVTITAVGGTGGEVVQTIVEVDPLTTPVAIPTSPTIVPVIVKEITNDPSVITTNGSNNPVLVVAGDYTLDSSSQLRNESMASVANITIETLFNGIVANTINLTIPESIAGNDGIITYSPTNIYTEQAILALTTFPVTITARVTSDVVGAFIDFATVAVRTTTSVDDAMSKSIYDTNSNGKVDNADYDGSGTNFLTSDDNTQDAITSLDTQLNTTNVRSVANESNIDDNANNISNNTSSIVVTNNRIDELEAQTVQTAKVTVDLTTPDLTLLDGVEQTRIGFTKSNVTNAAILDFDDILEEFIINQNGLYTANRLFTFTTTGAEVNDRIVTVNRYRVSDDALLGTTDYIVPKNSVNFIINEPAVEQDVTGAPVRIYLGFESNGGDVILNDYNSTVETITGGIASSNIDIENDESISGTSITQRETNIEFVSEISSNNNDIGNLQNSTSENKQGHFINQAEVVKTIGNTSTGQLYTMTSDVLPVPFVASRTAVGDVGFLSSAWNAYDNNNGTSSGCTFVADAEGMDSKIDLGAGNTFTPKEMLLRIGSNLGGTASITITFEDDSSNTEIVYSNATTSFNTDIVIPITTTITPRFITTRIVRAGSGGTEFYIFKSQVTEWYIEPPLIQNLKVKMNDDKYTDEDNYLINCQMEDSQDMENPVFIPTTLGVYSKDGLAELLAPVDYDGFAIGNNHNVKLKRDTPNNKIEQVFNYSDKFGKVVASATGFSGSDNDIIVDLEQYGVGSFKLYFFNFTSPTLVRYDLGVSSAGRNVDANDNPTARTDMVAYSTLGSSEVEVDGSPFIFVNANQTFISSNVIVATTSPASQVKRELLGASKIIYLASDYLTGTFDWILVKLHD